jgi:DNA-binding MarR family transcriptional regulator
MSNAIQEKFFKLSVELTARRDLKASDKILFAVLRDHENGSDFSWPGVRTLMKETGLASQTVLDAISRLECAGCLQVKRRGPGRSSHYRTVLETRALKKPDRPEKQDSGALKTRPEAFQKLEPNQTDLLNQTVESLSFPLNDGATWALPQEKLSQYQETYPNLDIPQELRKARQWLFDNPARQKTAKGMPKFLGGWMGRAKPPAPNKSHGKTNGLDTSNLYPEGSQAVDAAMAIMGGVR